MHAMLRPRKSIDEVTSSPVNVPFLWEKKPGTSKLKTCFYDHRYLTNDQLVKLTPPPRLSSPHYATSTPRHHHGSARLLPRSHRLCSKDAVRPLSATSFGSSFGSLSGTSPIVKKRVWSILSYLRPRCLPSCSVVPVNCSNVEKDRPQEDPFFAAFIKCSQMLSPGYTNGHLQIKNSTNGAVGESSKRKSIWSIFSSLSCGSF